jgi:hypothetical protein
MRSSYNDYCDKRLLRSIWNSMPDFMKKRIQSRRRDAVREAAEGRKV